MPLSPRGPDALRAWLLSVCYQILSACHGADWPAEPLAARGQDGRFRVHIMIEPGVAGDALNFPPAATPVERSILAAATREPATGKRLARLAGRPWNSRLRAALADLTRRGKLAHTPDGYRLP